MLFGVFREMFCQIKKKRMGVGAPGAAQEGPKVGPFFKNFQILGKNVKNERRAGPRGAIGFLMIG